MLQTIDLVKIYKPKKGVPVRALDGVTLTFPERGMVFLLGKSGSGKSTLLNVLGGLDRYDAGEIRIKGVSSKDFKQSHFDSYRNTYVGFIFQEYNILEEFSVGANIALALQLQGKKADDETINHILRQVDLDGFGNRKPNELSGGQKQRVAIARALVKSPEIIMADEPTGALDSVTGKQVLETLKKLSKEKLVIIVSHDREFAETYADRIIELADGKVIDDVERTGEVVEEAPEGLIFEENTVTVPGGYHLTEEDRIAINEYLEKGDGLKIIGKQKKQRLGFAKTNQENIKQGGGTFRLIKSRLPFRFAFPMGASGLKHKKIRLVFTILLSCIAFGLFGLADTFASYDHIRTSTDSIIDSNIHYASMEKTVAIKHDGETAYYDQVKLSQSDLDEIKEATGVSLEGVYLHNYDRPNFEKNVGDAPKDPSLYEAEAAGYVEVTEETVKSMGGTVVAGKMPDGSKNEIAISVFYYGLFAERGYYENTKDENAKLINIQKYDDIIGKTVLLNEKEYTITAVVDTKLNMDRYKPLIEDQVGATEADMLVLYALRQEFRYAVENSLAGTIMVGPGAVETMEKSNPIHYEEKDGNSPFTVKDGTVDLWLYAWRFGKLSENTHLDILWLDGQPRTELGEKEIVLPASMLQNNLFTEEPEKYLPSYIELMENPDYSHIANLQLSKHFTSYENGEFTETFEDGYRIVGLIQGLPNEEFLLMNDAYVDENTLENDGIWDHAIGGMPEHRGDIETLVTYCLKGTEDVVYELINPACYELNVVNEALQVLSKVFLWIGVGFAVFASLLLSNFIGTSISYKKQEIGILRAIGSRGNDVFRIFFSESFLIAAINFVLSAIGTGVVTAIINWAIRHETGLLITLLHFGIRQVILLLVVSIVIAAIASFVPVKRIASKRPIDAIRDR